MGARLFAIGVAIPVVMGVAFGQGPADSKAGSSAVAAGVVSAASATAEKATGPDAASPATKGWRAAGSPSSSGGQAGSAGTAPAADAAQPLKPLASLNRTPIARVTKGPTTLPNDAGQEWRDYDISSYTLRVTTTNRPEQAIVDWILRDTGYEAWHSEPLGLLSANRTTLRVYHTPQMHAVVGEMVDRFVNSEAESQSFGLRIITLGSPNWRTKAQRTLHAVPVQSQGVQAWLLAREDAALLVADMRRRSDFREHSTPQMLVNNGQSTVISATRLRNYVRDVITKNTAWPNYEPQVAQLDEGFSLEFDPLLSLDGRSIDAVIKCNVDQVEKMLPVMLDVPTPVAPRQRMKVEVPQISSCRLHERFHWPADQVLLISLGVVASPIPAAASPLNLQLPMVGSPSRADLLIFVENRGKLPAASTAQRPAAPSAVGPRSQY